MVFFLTPWARYGIPWNSMGMLEGFVREYTDVSYVAGEGVELNYT